MSQIFERCKQCVDSTIIDWEKARLSPEEKRAKEVYEVWGMVRLALYVLSNEEYFQFKQYIWDKHQIDVGGVNTGQYSLTDYKEFM